MIATFISTVAAFGQANEYPVHPASDGIHSAAPGQLGFMEAASPIMVETVAFHDMLMWIITIITIFVTAIMIYIFIKFNAKANPVPSKTTHNTMLEIVWTTVPVLILVVIAIPSFRLLYNQDVIPEADVTIKAIGNQWYWSYEYSDYNTSEEDTIAFDSYMIADDDLEEGQLRLLEVDNRVLVPTDTHVRVLVTSSDVLHS